MNQHTTGQLSKPASSAQIAEALDILFKSMRFHPGVDPEKATFGYMQALAGFSIEAIAAGITKFLRGECADVNPKFCPHPPELAQIVRSAVVQSRVSQAVETIKRVHVQEVPGERARMRFKMPMWRHAWDCGLMDELDAANRAGFGAMVVLAQKWGVEIPEELLADEVRTETDWRIAGDRARAAMEANPPPFMKRRNRAA